MIRYKIDIVSALEKKGINYYTCKETGKPFAQATYGRLKKQQSVSMDTLNKLCVILQCGVNDLIEYVPDAPQ